MESELELATPEIKPNDFLIDQNNPEELLYVAARMGCNVNDILEAIETLKTNKRLKIYTWLIDKAFRAQYKFRESNF